MVAWQASVGPKGSMVCSSSCSRHEAPVPGLMAASVWITSWMGRPVLPELISLPVPEMTPEVSV